MPVTKVKLANAIGNKENVKVFGSGSDFGIIEFSGTAKTTNTLNITKNAQFDGGIITSNRMEPRDITLTCEYLGKENKYEIRRKLIQFFNPKFPGQMYITFGEKTKDSKGKEIEPEQRKIDYHLENFAISNVNMYEPLKFMATFICPDPYFKEAESQYRDMTRVDSLFAIPQRVLNPSYAPGFAIPMGSSEAEYGGVALSLKKFNQEQNFSVDGDKEVGVKIVFYAMGDVKKPLIENVTTQKYIQVLTEMEVGDRIEINTRFGEKSVISIKQDGTQEKISHLIDPGSSFFTMQPGDNLIRYDTETGFYNLTVELEWENKYLGV